MQPIIRYKLTRGGNEGINVHQARCHVHIAGECFVLSPHNLLLQLPPVRARIVLSDSSAAPSHPIEAWVLPLIRLPVKARFQSDSGCGRRVCRYPKALLLLAPIVYIAGSAHLAGRPVAGSGGLELAAEAAGGGDCNQGDKRREMGDTY